MKNNYLLLLLLLINQTIYSQSFNWANSFGSIGIDQGFTVESDAANNLYYTGRYQGNVDFDPSSGTNFLLSNGSFDIFLSKYSEQGKLIWANSIGGISSTDNGRDIAIDAASNIYLAGAFGGTVDFDPSSNVTNLSATSGDAFLAKYDSSGAFQWVVQFGGKGNEEAWSVSIDNSNNAYVSGFFTDSLSYSQNGVNSSLSSSGSNDIFNAKVDSSGNIVWIHKIGGSGFDKGVSNIISTDNNLYITGEFSNTVDFDPSSSNNSESSNGSTDIFILKLDTAGAFVWVKSFGGSSIEVSKKITVNQSNKVIAVGSFRNTVDFDPSSSTQSYTSNGDEEMFIEVLDKNGTFEWAKQIGGTSRDVILGVETDSKNNLYTTGFFFGSVDFDPGAGTMNLTAQGLADSFVQKLDSNGNFVWVEQFKSNGDVVGTSFVLISLSNMVLVGSYEQTADFDPSSTSFNKTSNGNRDIFMLSLNICDILRDSLIEASCGSFNSPSGKYTWTTSGIYFDTLQTFDGCDSILRIDLTIYSIEYDSLSIVSCDSIYTSPSGNYTWRNSGTYNDTILSTPGCDSILTIKLSFSNASSYFMNQSACDSYVSPSGKTYTSGGLFYDTIPNAKGCDSLITIFLTLKSNSTLSQTVTSCRSYLSPSNKLYTTSGTYLDTLQNSVGCDSIITTNLTINSFTNGVLQNGTQLIANQNNAQYQWLDCNNNFAPLANDTNQTFSSIFTGSYAVEISDSNCIDTSSCFSLIITSTDKFKVVESIEIYPNPSQGIIQLESSIIFSSLEVFSTKGKQLLIINEPTNKIDLSSIPRGVYILKFKSENATFVRKLILSNSSF